MTLHHTNFQKFWGLISQPQASHQVTWVCTVGQDTALVADPGPPSPPSPPPGTSTAADNAETINTPEDKAAILGNREMDPDVPAVWMIESGVSSKTTISLLLLLVAPFLLFVLRN